MARIVIAEDSPMQVKLIQSALDRADYDLEFFSDGLEAYLHILNDPPDLIILDIILPTLSGTAMSRLLKFHERYRHIPLLMMSSITESDIAEWANRIGADRFMTKPLDLPALIGNVAEMLSARLACAS